MTLTEANAYVERNHRHSVPTVGHKFSIGAAVGDEIVGVAIVGRPVARGLDDGWTLEVLRVCTDGTRNAPSMLYRTCWRASRAMGYRKLVTRERHGVVTPATASACAMARGGSGSRFRKRPPMPEPEQQAQQLTPLDGREIMCVGTNRAGTAQTAPPRHQEVES